MWRRACGYGVFRSRTESRVRAGSQSSLPHAFTRATTHSSSLRSLRSPTPPNCGRGSTPALRPPSSFSSPITFATSTSSCAATVPARSGRVSSLATTSPKPSFSGSSPAASYPETSSPSTMDGPQRNAAVAARAAHPRFRRRADCPRRRAARLASPWHQERALPALGAPLELPFEASSSRTVSPCTPAPSMRVPSRAPLDRLAHVPSFVPDCHPAPTCRRRAKRGTCFSSLCIGEFTSPSLPRAFANGLQAAI
jgi:hypothetical protein